MKILIAHDTYYPDVNGASYFTQRLAKHLQLLGHEIAVMAPSRKFSDEVFEHDDIKILGVQSFPVERIRVATPIMSSASIKNYIKDFNPDVIHIQGHFPIGRKTAKFAHELGIPVIGTNHFMPDNLVHFLPLPSQLKQTVENIAWNDFVKIFNKLTSVTTPTHTAAGLIENVGLNHNVKVISNGIDLNKFKSTNSGDYLKTRYNLPDKPILLCVGRLDKEKNVDQILKSLSVATQTVDLHFVISGVGAEKNNLLQLTEQLNLTDKVTFAGFVPDEDLPNLYAIATCFIAAGTAELQSISTMEAMATGLPIIAVNAMALPELVHDGENGYLYEHNDTKHLTEIIVKIFKDPVLRKSLGEKSSEIIAKHSIDKIMNKFVELYSEALKIKI